jgi:hypothetical protein
MLPIVLRSHLDRSVVLLRVFRHVIGLITIGLCMFTGLGGCSSGFNVIGLTGCGGGGVGAVT